MGVFVAIEGPDGTGKSTLLAGLKEELKKTSLKVFYFREPGGTELGEKIRELILDNNSSMEYETEALLFAAIRSENHAFLQKALNEYDLIIADRFLLSSLAYQGEGLGLGIDEVLKINDFSLHGFRPDLNLVFLLQNDEGLRRKMNQKELDRLEKRKEIFQKKVTEGYLKLIKSGKYKIETIDANQTPDEVLKDSLNLINKLLKSRRTI